MTELSAFIGRDNEEKLSLLEDGVAVTAGVATRAVFKFGPWCIDSNTNPTLIYFENANNQTVCLVLGLVAGISAGEYTNGRLTIYDAVNTNGIAWGSEITVVVQAWTVCI